MNNAQSCTGSLTGNSLSGKAGSSIMTGDHRPIHVEIADEIDSLDACIDRLEQLVSKVGGLSEEKEKVGSPIHVPNLREFLCESANTIRFKRNRILDLTEQLNELLF